MELTNWLALVAASVVMLAIPGPTVLLVVSYALSHGRKAASATVAGVALGDFTAMTASLLGLGALLATSAEVFHVLRLIGAAYLVYLGIKLWRAPVAGLVMAETAETNRTRIFLHAYAVTALNPKGIVFFVAFLPQFLSRDRPLFGQFLICEATFLVLATLTATAYALLAAGARRTIRRPATQRVVNRVGGGLLVGAGLFTAAWRGART